MSSRHPCRRALGEEKVQSAATKQRGIALSWAQERHIQAFSPAARAVGVLAASRAIVSQSSQRKERLFPSSGLDLVNLGQEVKCGAVLDSRLVFVPLVTGPHFVIRRV